MAGKEIKKIIQEPKMAEEIGVLDPKKKVERFFWDDKGKYAMYTDGTISPMLKKVKPIRDEIKPFIVKPMTMPK